MTMSTSSSMVGKIVLITGASSGLGFVSARILAGRGAKVLMVCRDKARGVAARDAIAHAGGEPPVLLLADLASQSAIRGLADQLAARFDRIDVLMNNAGAIFARRELTEDGIERTFALNHLAPFLLTRLVLDLLRAAPAGRIVTVASHAYSSTLDFANLQSEKGHNAFAAQFRSKLENILFTYELARRLDGSSITANCVSPGPTVTRFGNGVAGIPGLLFGIIKRIPFLLQDVERGAESQIYLASSPEVATLSGRFFMKGRERATKPITHSRELASRLWTVSEQLCGLAVS